MNYEEWHKEYMEKKIINLKNELNENSSKTNINWYPGQYKE